MAKNITILEGRETRTFGNVEKIQTNLVGGGTQNWIPEDEAASYVETEDLSVDENGYYAPEPGSFFSSVDVNVEVEPDLEEITITENGTYTPQGDGFSSVSVEVDTSGQGGDPSVHGNEVTAVATTDINAGDTVAVQDDSHEPVSVSCPLPDRMFDQYGNASALKYDGKNIYWIKYIDPYTREVRKKPLANIESERYTVVATIPNGWGSVAPWYFKESGTDSEGSYQALGSVFSNKLVKYYTQGAQGLQWVGEGKATSVYYMGIYDKANKKVNDTWGSNINAWRMISGSRMLRTGHADGQFGIILLGGNETTYNVDLPQGVDTLANNSVSAVMFAGNNVIYIGYDSQDSTNKKIIACPFDDAEYDQPRTSDASVICDLDFTNFAIGSDTTFDRWAIATDNGLIVIHSDLSYDIYSAITATATPYLIGDYVFIGQSCYKLMGDGAKMVATSSKGTAGQLGVAKHNVRAGEEGTAIILFS